MLKKGEAYRSHITAYRKVIRTTVRMDADLWTEFKKETKTLNLTTCLVYRALIHQWLDRVRPLKRHTKMENATPGLGISRNKHDLDVKHCRFEISQKEVRWIYCKMTQTLYDPRKLKSWRFNRANPNRLV